MTYERHRMARTIPIRTVSEVNRHEHWRVRASRAKSQRFTAHAFCRASIKRRDAWTRGPIVVTMCRVSGRLLDTDNLPCSMKHLRDGVADSLGRKDGPNDGIEWRYSQRKRGKSDPYHAVEIAIYSVEDG